MVEYKSCRQDASMDCNNGVLAMPNGKGEVEIESVVMVEVKTEVEIESWL